VTLLTRLPFRHHFALVVTLTSALAVGLAGLGTLWFERHEAYLQVRQDYLPLARIIASNSEGALSFADPRAATETLAALSLKPHVAAARLFTVEGAPFATYERRGTRSSPLPAAPPPGGHRFAEQAFLVVEPVVYDGDTVGTLYLEIDTSFAASRIWRAAIVLGLVFLVATAVALFASTRLQSGVTSPVLALAGAVQQVAAERRYDVRVEPAGPVELQALTRGFNEMISEIRARDEALLAAREELERRVEARVGDLRREVEERRKAEVRSDLLSQAMASSRDLISITGLDGRFTFVNAAFVEAYGYPAAEVIGCTPDLVDSPQNPVDAAGQILEATRRGGWRGERINRRRDGEEFPIALSTSIVRDAEGREVGLLGVATDITTTRQREETLRLQSAALESTADAVMLTDRAGTISWVNPAFTALTGYEPEYAVGRTPSILRSEKQDDAFYADLWRTILAGEVWDGELVNRRQDGRLYLEAQTITPVRDAAGAISHFVAVKRDVSQRRRLEDQLRQAQKMEAVGQLSGGIAHDFNNLLNVIIGFGGMMLKHLPADDRLRRYGHQILAAANRGAGLTRQLLAFSRQQVLQPKVLDLNVVVSEAEKMLARLIGEHVELATSLAPDLGCVEVDPSQIEQVIMNLAVNARDAMPEGGLLAIETSNVELTEEDSARHGHPVTPGSYVSLVVSDAGTGMDDQAQAHIFEPFFTTKPAGEGTGLGLATVYGIVKQSKGYIWVASAPGQGSRFTILLPRVDRRLLSAGPGLETPAELRGSETILLAEDDPAGCAMWTEILGGLGYRVIPAMNGFEALEQSRVWSDRIDLLVTDAVMPRMGGRELVERLTSERPGLRVIFMSGYTTDTVLRQDVAQTGWPFLQKPFTAQQLVAKMREVLDDRKPS
jgi:two-component system, cell cycle sensor histidine kinase and response regulator CckA